MTNSDDVWSFMNLLERGSMTQMELREAAAEGRARLPPGSVHALALIRSRF